MKLKENINPDILLDYGFTKINKKDYNSVWESQPQQYYDYEYTLGAGRRGQYYVLLYAVGGSFDIYATEPDGSGAPTNVDDIFIKLVTNNIVE